MVGRLEKGLVFVHRGRYWIAHINRRTFTSTSSCNNFDKTANSREKATFIPYKLISIFLGEREVFEVKEYHMS